MTEERLALSELLEKAGDGDFLRSVAEAVLQLLMETDVDGLIGAGRYERSGERTTWRNGHRDRVLDTRLGSLQLRIPKLRQGSYFPPFLEARKVSEKALIGVSMVAAALRQALSSRIVRRQARRCVTWPTSCGRNGRSLRRSLTTARPTFCRIWTSPSSTGPSCTARMRSTSLSSDKAQFFCSAKRRRFSVPARFRIAPRAAVVKGGRRPPRSGAGTRP